MGTVNSLSVWNIIKASQIDLKNSLKMKSLILAILIIFMGIWTLSESAPAEENMEPQDRGCWSFGKDEYRGCCDCSKQKDKTCKISNMQCKPGFRCICGETRWGFGFGTCTGQCKK